MSNLITHEPCASRDKCYHAQAGRIGGQINVQSGQLIKAQKKAHAMFNANPEMRKRISKLGGPIGGRRRFELYGTPATPESRAKGARKRNKLYGNPATLEGCRKGGSIGGRVVGRKNVESGHLARIARGVPSTADGILFRSQMEASFYCIIRELGGNLIYEPRTIALHDGTSYTPDFILSKTILGIPSNVPIELKPAQNAYYNGNIGKARKAGALIVYWNELVNE